jgi:anti-sigma regulatory factor (Ser/Thr protein kinase)
VNVDSLSLPIHSTSSVARESGDPRLSWRAVLIAFTAIALLRFTYLYLDDVTRAVSGTAVRRLIEETSAAYTAMLLFVGVFLLERRYPFTDGRGRRNWPVHVVALITYSVAHTSLIWISRVLIVPLIQHVPYDYGRMPVRYLMESPNDVIAYCGFIGILTFLRLQHTLREREVRVAALARDAAEARLEMLAGRLQPHFLFNALNTISSTVYDNPAAADEMIGQLGSLLRRSLRASDQPEFALGDELEVLQAYLAIIGARFGDRVRVDLQVQDGASSVAVPAFLLQPLVENAVRHGSGVEHASTILVKVERRDGDLCIMIENEIAGIESGDPIPGTGLATTRDRLRLLYGDAYTFTARAEGDRFRVTIRIPVRTTRALPRISGPVAHAGADR